MFFFDPFQPFFPPSLESKLLKLSVFNFFLSWPWKIGLRSSISTLYLFSKAFFYGEAIHRFRAPNLYRVKEVKHSDTNSDYEDDIKTTVCILCYHEANSLLLVSKLTLQVKVKWKLYNWCDIIVDVYLKS